MEPRPIGVFCYGLVMDIDLLLPKGVHATEPRSAGVSGFALRIGQRATLMASAESSACGILFEASRAEFEQLHSEPSLGAYRPRAVMARLVDGLTSRLMLPSRLATSSRPGKLRMIR